MTKKYRDPIPDWLIAGFLKMLDPIVRASTRFNVHPNTFTTISFFLGFIAAYLAATQNLRLSAGFILLSGICDAIDGKLARHSGKVTRFGALYDSTLDRYSEVLFFFGLAYYFIQKGEFPTSVAVAVGLGGSLMVSYVRARAEGLGLDCKVGMLQRAERILLLGASALIHEKALVGAIWIVAVLSNVTAVQRILHVWKIDRKSQMTSEGEH
jgi:CDP-diacylglycerol--glycerol-3-phosphate 3-phosphatidyltransferase